MAQEWKGLAVKSKTNYTKKGRKNKSKYMDFVHICKKTQEVLKSYVYEQLQKYYDEVVIGDGFVYARGAEKVLLTAHLDTVHDQPVDDFYEYCEKGRTIISSPQGIGGDDRCGVYMILNILRTTQLRPYILFCEDEETGGKGSAKFVKTAYIDDLKEMNCLIELDRANATDLVYYDDVNEKFHDWCASVTGYKENWGSFSDISHLSPVCGIAGVNISCGYYNAHTTDEYVVMEEMFNSINKTIDIINASTEQFEYVEDLRGQYWGLLGEDSNVTTYNDYLRSTKCDYGTTRFSFVINETQDELIVEGESFYSCVAKLLMENPTLCWADIYDYYDISDWY